MQKLEHGRRVHYLANLGGLVSLAGLENLTPRLLLGAFVKLKSQLDSLSFQHKQNLSDLGKMLLDTRAADKRSFKAYQAENNLARFDLTKEQMKKILITLGGAVPALESDLETELRRVLKKYHG